MSETIAIILLISLNAAAVCLTALVTWKFGRHYKVAAGRVSLAAVGVVIACELVRRELAFAIEAAAKPWLAGDLAAWLIHFRLFTVPILIGVGFLAFGVASAAPVVSVRGSGSNLYFPSFYKGKDFRFRFVCNRCKQATIMTQLIDERYTVPCTCGYLHSVVFTPWWQFWR